MPSGVSGRIVKSRTGAALGRVSGDSMFPDPPEPPQLVQTSAQGPWAARPTATAAPPAAMYAACSCRSARGSVAADCAEG
jgi:hypothetical protein